MFDHKFERNQKLSTRESGLVDRLKCKDFRDISNVFVANVGRVKALGRLPLELNYWSSVFTFSITKARFDLGLPHHDGPLTDAERHASNLTLREMSNQKKQFDVLHGDDHFLDKVGGNLRSFIAEDVSGELAAGHEAILSSMIVEAWSSFEAMCVDLWTAAVNIHPQLGLKIVGNHKYKNFNLAAISRFVFDLTNKVGSLLVDFNKVSFDSFKEIKNNFEDAFGSESKNIFMMYPDLGFVEQTRHIIAHRSGIADAKYLRISASKRQFDELREGARIPLTGDVVAGQVNCCIECGVSLIEFVDTWSNNEQKRSHPAPDAGPPSA